MRAAPLILFLFAAVPHGQDGPPARQNLVLFLVDDLGWQDLSLPLHAERTPFNERYRTPNVERLAARGVTFTAAYASSPVCTPTRRSIHTGQSPARHRTTNWILRAERPPGGGHPTVAPPDWDADGLGADDVTLARLLQSAGYRTIHVGKAHLGAVDTSGADPENLGFDVNIGGHAAGGPGSFRGTEDFSATKRKRNPSADRVWDVPGLEAYHGKDVFLTEALTLEALAAVRAAAADGAPFFLNFSHYAVHAPITPDARYVGSYADIDPIEAAYASMVEGVDASLGAVLDLLDELEIADQTTVVFFSDNGGLSAHGRGGERHTHNAPLRSGKGSAYEGGVRVPLVIAQPHASRTGEREGRPVIAEDLFPTLLALAGVEMPEAHAPSVDGVDLAPLLRGADGFPPDRAFGWHYPHQWGAPGPGIEPFSAVRGPRHKLIWFHADGRFELYDLLADLGESRDLAADEPEVLAAMVDALRAYLERTGAQLPVARNTGLPLPLPVP